MEKQKKLLTNTLTTPFVYYNKAENLSEKALGCFDQGVVGMQQNNAQVAIEGFQGALKESPEAYHALNNLGAFIASIGRPGDGVRILEEGIKKHPKNAELRYNLGTLLFMHNAAQQAQNELSQAQSLQGNSAPILNNLALTYLHTGHFIRSKELLENVIALYPQFDTAYHNLGHVMYAQHEYAQAAHFFEEAISRNPQNVISLNDLACCYYCDGLTELAITKLKKALSLQSNLQSAYFNMGYIAYTESLC